MNLTLRLLDRCHEAENVTSFRFESQPPVSYQAGQYLRYTLPHPAPDSRGTTRFFTMASAPSEPFIMLATRLSSPGSTFKQALAGLERGAVLTASGPLGHFTYTDYGTPAVFIAGGIGVTPFRSMLVELAAQPRNARVTLLYANSTPDIAFRGLLDELAQAHPELRIVYVVSHPTADWDGPVGHIDAAFIDQHVPDALRSLYHSSGPQPMVEAMGQALAHLGVPREQIKQEIFPGYGA
ncbi:MAG TPA: FAD-dependent oxidoreductase [Chloroflexota bacterium]|jgi:ferredoxin-NADP reductase